MAQFKRATTTDLINNGKYANAVTNTIIETLGFTTKGDGGAAQWKKTGVTGLTASQTPAQLGDAKLSDALGHEWEHVPRGGVDIPIAELGAKQDASINASGTLSGTDDSDIIIAALASAASVDGNVVATNAFRVTKQINILDGTTFTGNNESFSAPLYRAATGYEFDGGTVCFVDFGSGLAADDYANCPFKLNDRAALKKIGFWYAGQDMSSTGAPTTFPAAVCVNPTAQSAVVEDINFANSYACVDAWRDHTACVFRSLRGHPLFKGLRVGSQGDVDTIENIHFQPLWVYRGSFDNTNTPVGWVSANAIAFELGRQSWTDFTNLFAFGYNKGVHAIYQAAGTNITNPGGVETCNFIGANFDSCYFGYHFDKNGQAGNTHFGNHINGCRVVSKDPNDAARTSGRAFKIDLDATATVSDFSFSSVRTHGCVSTAMEAINVDGLTVDDSCQIFDYGVSGVGGDGVSLSGCEDVTISAQFNGQNRGTLTSAVNILGSSSNLNIGGTYSDYSVVPILIANNSNSGYVIDKIAASTSGVDVISDAQNDSESVIGNNIVWDQFSEFLTNSDVDGSGILTIPLFGRYFRYIGTSTISGISVDKKGRQITLAFSNAVTVERDAAGTGSSIIRLRPTATDLTTASNLSINLTYGGSDWFSYVV